MPRIVQYVSILTKNEMTKCTCNVCTPDLDLHKYYAMNVTENGIEQHVFHHIQGYIGKYDKLCYVLPLFMDVTINTVP